MSQHSAPSFEDRLKNLEQKIVIAVPAPAPAPAASSKLTKYGPGAASVAALIISIFAICIPFSQQQETAKRELNAEQGAAIGPVLNDVFIAEKKLWEAKMELSSSAQENVALESEITELQSAYLDATYQVLPHGGLEEISAMNRLTQVVLSSGYSPGEKSEQRQISPDKAIEHSKRVSDFHKMYSCAVNTSPEEQCE